MDYQVDNITDYLNALPEERQVKIDHLRESIQTHLPSGFEETFQYNMITYVVPLKRYPKGYLNKKDTPLPFISIASQKHHIALYHMGIYMDESLLEWFETEYKNTVDHSLNMGKSCIRWKDTQKIPYSLIEELVSKMTVADFIAQYEKYH